MMPFARVQIACIAVATLAVASSHRPIASAESSGSVDNPLLGSHVLAQLDGLHRASLEMRENVDFLVSPALIVQSFLRASASGRDHRSRAGQAVAFEAVMRLNSEAAGTHLVLFVEYAVTADSFACVVRWAEPHTGALNFAGYPVAATLVSTPEAFAISQGVHDKRWRFDRPLGRRPDFGFVHNSYDLRASRFAESDRLYDPMVAEMINKAEHVSGWHKDDPVHVTATPSVTWWHRTASRIDRVRELDATGDPIREVDYEYDSQNAALQRVLILEHEYPITVRVPRPITVQFNGRDHELTRWQLPDLVGGRLCVIDVASQHHAQPTGIGPGMPTSISIFNAASGKMLRRVEVTRFTPPPQADLSGWAQERTRIDPAVRHWYGLCSSIWYRHYDEMEPTLQAGTEQLASAMQHTPRPDDVSLRFRQVHIDLTLALVAGDAERCQQLVGEYIQLAAATDLNELALIGGREMIALAIWWNRPHCARMMIDEYARWAGEHVIATALAAFAYDCLTSHHYWLAFDLCDHAVAQYRVAPPLEAEFRHMKVRAAGYLAQITGAPDQVTYEFDKAQAGCLLRLARPRAYRKVAAGEVLALQSHVDTINGEARDAWLEKVRRAKRAISCGCSEF